MSLRFRLPGDPREYQLSTGESLSFTGGESLELTNAQDISALIPQGHDILVMTKSSSSYLLKGFLLADKTELKLPGDTSLTASSFGINAKDDAIDSQALRAISVDVDSSNLTATVQSITLLSIISQLAQNTSAFDGFQLNADGSDNPPLRTLFKPSEEASLSQGDAEQQAAASELAELETYDHSAVDSESSTPTDSTAKQDAASGDETTHTVEVTSVLDTSIISDITRVRVTTTVTKDNGDTLDSTNTVDDDGTVTITIDDDDSGDQVTVDIVVTDPEDDDKIIDRTELVVLLPDPFNEENVSLFLSGNSVMENLDGALVGSLAAFGTEDEIDGPFTYSIVEDPSGLFEIQGSDLKLKDGTQIDFETAPESYQLTIQIENEDGTQLQRVVSLNPADANDAPEISSVALSGSEDTAIPFELATFEQAFSDMDSGDELNAIRFDTLPANGTILLDGNPIEAGQSIAADQIASLSFEPLEDWNGQTTFQWSGFDGEDWSGQSRTVSIDLASINDAPVATFSIGSQTANEDAAFTFDLPADLFSDADDAGALTLSADLPAWLSFDPATGRITGVPSFENIGEHRIEITATDPHGASGTSSFILDVSNVNDRPTFTQIQDVSISEYESVDIDAGAHFTDEDIAFGDSLTFSATLGDGSDLPDWLAIDPQSGKLTGTPPQGEDTDLEIRVTATDESGEEISSAFALHVENQNDAPTLDSEIADQSTDEDAAFSFNIASHFSDSDIADTLTFQATLPDGSPLPEWLSFDSATGQFSGTPANEDVGMLTIQVTASDGEKSVDDFFAIMVNNTNDGPVATALVDQTVAEDSGFSLDVSTAFSDVDAGDTLTYSATLLNGSELPDWLEFDETTGTFSGTPENDDVGEISILVVASDGTESANAIFSIEVENTNDGPVATYLPDQSVEEDATFIFDAADAFSDVDTDDALTYSATLENGDPLPSWLSLNASTGELSGTPENGDVGTIALTVTATDGAGESASTTLNITIENTNDGPFVTTSIEDLATAEDAAFQLDVSSNFGDPDFFDELTFSATLSDGSPLPAWLEFDPFTATFSGTPENSDVGSIEVTVTASDSSGASASDTFAITVENTNDGPVVSSPINDLQADLVAESDYRGSGIDALGLEADTNVFTLNFTTSGDVDSSQTLFESGGVGRGLNVVIDEGMIKVFAALDTEVVLSAPVEADTEYNFALEINKDTDSLTLLLSDSLSLEEMTVENSLADQLTGWSEDNWDGGGGMGVGGFQGTAKGELGGDFTGTIGGDGLTVFANSTLEDYQQRLVGEDSPFSYDVSSNFVDEDAGDTLTYSATLENGNPLPSWLSIDSATGVLSGNPENGDDGTISITVTATDLAGETVSDTFAITVEDTNQGPVVTAVAIEDAAFSLDASETFSDAATGDTLTYSATLENGDPLPEWLSIDSATGELSGTPGNEDVGSISLTVTATNQAGTSDSETFAITVENTNDGPILVKSINDFHSDFTAENGYGGDGIDTLGLESDSNVFTLNFTTSGDVETAQTLFETGGVGRGLNVFIEDGMIKVIAGSDSEVALSAPIAADTTYNFALEVSKDSDSLTLLLSDSLDLADMTVENSLVDQLTGWTVDDWDNGGTMGVGGIQGYSKGLVGGDFTGTMGEDGLTVFANSTLENYQQRLVSEDAPFSYDVSQNFADVDVGDTLTYSATLENGNPLPSWLSIDSSTGLLSGTPENGDVGSISVTVIATDGSGESASDTFAITVENTNDGPVATAIADQSVDEDTAFSLDVSSNFTDVDEGDSLTFSAALENGDPLPSWLSFDSATGLLSGTPLDGDEGTLSVTVTATDNTGTTASDTFAITVENTNDGPVATAIADQNTDEDSPYLLDVSEYFTDTDVGDSLSYIATLENGDPLPSWLSFDGDTGELFGTPENGDVGSFSVTVTATDQAGISASNTFALTVENTNDGPVVTSAISDFHADLVAESGYRGSGIDALGLEADTNVFTLNFTTSGDVESSQTLFESGGVGRGLNVVIDEGMIKVFAALDTEVILSAPIAADTEYNFALEINKDTDSLTLLLSDSLSLEEMTVENSLADQLTGWDEDNWDGGGGMGVGGLQGTAKGTLGGDFTGTIGGDGLTVFANSTLEDYQQRLVSEDAPFSYDASQNFADEDVGDTLAYSATLENGDPLPSWLSIDSATGLLSGTPENGDVGTLSVTVTATDNSGATASDTFAITVENTNDGPVATADTASIAEDGTTTTGNVLTNDSDVDAGDTLSVSDISGGTVGSAMAGSYGSVTLNADGSYSYAVDNANATVQALADGETLTDTFTYTVSDGNGGTDTATLTVTINGTNDAPTVSAAIADQTTDEDAAFSLDVSSNFADEDAGDTLTYSATLENGDPLPSWLSIDSATGELSGTPENGDVGSISVTVTATDGSGATASDTFAITVENTNDGPVVTSNIVDFQPDLVAEGGYGSYGVNALGLETGSNVFTLNFTTSADVTTTQTLFETGGTGQGLNVIIDDGQIKVLAGTGGDIEITAPLSADTEYNFALEVSSDNETLTLLLSDSLSLEEMTAENSLAGQVTDWTDVGWDGGSGMGVGKMQGSAQGSVGGNFSGTIGEAGLSVFANATLDDYQQRLIDQGESFSYDASQNFADEDVGDTLTYSATLENGDPLPSWLSIDSATGLLSGTPENGDVGSISVTATATDGSGATATDTFAITVENTNDGPVATADTNSIAEDGTTTSGNVLDNDTDVDAGDSLSVSDISGGTVGSALAGSYGSVTLNADGSYSYAIDNGNATVQALADGESITDTFTYTVSDGNGGTDTATLTVTISGTNDAPTVSSAIADASTDEDAAFTLDTSAAFSDVDATDTLTYSATLADDSPLPSWLSINASTGELSGTPENGDVGTISVKVTASDGTATATDTFDLTVENTNDGPTVSAAIADQTTDEDAAFSLDVSSNFADEDAGDTLTYSATLENGDPLPSWLSIDSSTGALTGTPENGDVGSISVTVTATDGSGATASDTFAITVENTNDGPVAISASGLQASYYHLDSDPAELADIDFEAEPDFVQTVQEVNFDAARGAVYEGGPEDNVAIKYEGSVVVDQAGEWNFRVTGDDGYRLFVDGQEVLAFDGPHKAKSATGSIELSEGSHTIELFYFEIGGDASLKLEWMSPGDSEYSVISGDSLRPYAPIEAIEDQSFSLNLSEHFADEDIGDTLTYTATLENGDPLPSWLSIDSATGLLSGTPENGDVGSISVTVTATDGSGATASDTFDLTVSNTNDGPTVSAAIADQTTDEDAAFSLDVSANFADEDLGDTLTYSATLENGDPLPAWLSIDTATGELSGTPENGDVGTLTVTVTATDGSGETASDTFAITVENTNDGPVATADTASIAEDGTTTSGNVLTNDSDVDAGDTLSVSDISGGTVGSALAGSYGSVTLNADGSYSYAVDNGNASVQALADGESLTDTFTYTVSDGNGGTDTATLTVTINGTNDAPTVSSAIADTSTDEDAAFTLDTSAAFSDVDATDTLTYTATLADDSPLPSWLSINASTGELSGTPDNGDVGTISVKVTATDGTTSATDTFDLTVENTNDGPTVSATIADQTTDEDAAFSLDVSANFADEDAGDTLTYSATLENGDPLPSWLSIDSATGELSGTPENGDVGSISVTVTATDGSGETASDTFAITVENTNDGPVATADTASIAEDGTTTTGNVLTNDSDVDSGDSLSVSDISGGTVGSALAGSYGSVTLNADGSYSYAVDNGNPAVQALADGESITDTFTYTVSDGNGGTDTATLTVTINGTNDGPTALALDVPQTNTAEYISSENIGNYTSIGDLGFETESNVFTISFTTASDISGNQTIFETGSSVAGLNVIIQDGVLNIYAGTGDNVELSTAISADTSYNLVLETNKGTDTLTLLLSDTLNTSEMTEANSLAAQSTTWTDTDLDAGGNMNVGNKSGGMQGDVSGKFLGSIDGDGLSVYADATISNYQEQRIEENDLGAVVGTLSTTDTDTSDTHTYTVSDSRFEVVAGQLKLKDTESLDRETESSIEVTVTSTDSAGASIDETFTIHVSDVDDHDVGAINDSNASENSISESASQWQNVGITASATDADATDNYVTYTLTDDAGGRFLIDRSSGQVKLKDPSLIDFESASSHTIEVTATARDGSTSVQTFTVNITDVNEAPTLTALIADQTTDEDAAFSLDVSANFADEDAGDTLTYSATLENGDPLPSWLSIDSATGELSGTPENGDVGTLSVTVTATDGSGETASDTFAITVENTNDGLVATADAATIAEDGTTTSGNVLTNDTDVDAGDSLSVSDISGGTVGSALAGSYGSVTLNSDGSYSYAIDNANAAVQALADGESITDTFTYTVSDGNGGTDTATLTVTINGTNDAPSLTSAISPGADYTAADGFASTQSLSTLGYETDSNVFSLSFTTDTDVNTAQTLFETGGQGWGLNVAIEDGLLKVFAGNGNDLELSSAINGETSYNLLLEVNKGSDKLTLLLSDSLPLESMTEANSLADQQTDWTDTDWDGGDAFGVGNIAGGAQGYSTGGDFLGTMQSDLSVYKNANLDNYLMHRTGEDSAFNLDTSAAFSDVDASDTLTYSATLENGEPLPSWLSINSSTGELSGTPENGDVGDISVTVTATDGSGASASETFELSVYNTNDGPTVSATIADQTTAEDAAFSLDVSANFADEDAGDTLTYSATLENGDPLPSWLSIDASTGVISGTPENGDVGSISVTVTATDGSGETVTDTFAITVENTNDGPVATSDAASIAEDGTTTSGNVLTNDSDVDAGDSLSVSDISGGTVGSAHAGSYGSVTLNSDGTYSYAIDNANPAVQALADGESITDTFTYTVSDGNGGTDTATLTVTINGTNDAPTVSATIADQNVDEEAAFSLDTSTAFTDVDSSDTLTYSATLENGDPLPTWLSINSVTGELSGTPADGDDGIIGITVTATDSSGTQASSTFELTVNDTVEPGETIYGTYLTETHTTGSGDDYIETGGGEDIVNAGDGDNTVIGNYGNETITTGSGDDYIETGNGIDIVDAGDGNNTIIGSDGNEDITSGSGNDYIETGNGLATVNAGDGDNTVIGSNSAQNITTGSGSDTISVGYGNDTVSSGAGNDTISFKDAGNTIDAGSGNDIIHMEELNTAFGDIDGGDGDDTFRITMNNQSLDFDYLSSSSLQNIETLDIDGTNNTVRLSADQVLNMTDADNVLFVDGDADDTVEIDSAYSSQGTETFNGTDYTHFYDAVTDTHLYINTDITDTPTF